MKNKTSSLDELAKEVCFKIEVLGSIFQLQISPSMQFDFVGKIGSWIRCYPFQEDLFWRKQVVGIFALNKTTCHESLERGQV